MNSIKIKRILIPLDFLSAGQLALEQGAYMAKLFNAQLYLVNVIEINEFVYTGYESAFALPIDSEKIENSAKTNLEGYITRIKNHYGINPISIVKRGKVVSEITELAEELNIDIIIMGTHGASGFKEFFIGSNAHKIINNSTCPVITFQEHTKSLGFKNIVLPIDNSLHSRQKVVYAVAIAKHYNSFVHILGLMLQDFDEFSDENVEKNKFMIKIKSVEKVLAKSKIKFSTEIRLGNNTANEALKFSKEVGADLIMIMTDHESHLNAPILNPFAKQIINHSQIPVMSINPTSGSYEVSDFMGSNNAFEY
jgi:nucleotide-binding universal stress UspA family protein